MNEHEFKRCPCGQYPDTLVQLDNGQAEKYIEVSGDCCGQWSVEVRVDYLPMEEDEFHERVKSAWNDAQRAPSLQDPDIRKDIDPMDLVYDIQSILEWYGAEIQLESSTGTYPSIVIEFGVETDPKIQIGNWISGDDSDDLLVRKPRSKK